MPASEPEDGEDFEDFTVPEQPAFVELDVAFDRAPVRACERALRTVRRRARVRRVMELLGSGAETVAARPRARRRSTRLPRFAAGLSIVATMLIALAMSGT